MVFDHGEERLPIVDSNNDSQLEMTAETSISKTVSLKQ